MDDNGEKVRHTGPHLITQLNMYTAGVLDIYCFPRKAFTNPTGSKTSFDAIQASKRGHSCSFRKCTSEKKVKERNRVPLRTNPSEFSLHLVELT